MHDQEKPFDRAEMAEHTVKLMRDGGGLNAVVTLVEKDGVRWTVKDFSTRGWFSRTIVGPLLLRREAAVLARLKGIDGIAGEAFFVDRQALAIRFLEGSGLVRKKGVNRSPVDLAYMERLEALVDEMHARGVAHLDLRGTGNFIIRPDGTPGLIDFQSAVIARYFPGWLRRMLEHIDDSGVLKKWNQFLPEQMGEARRAALQRFEEGRMRYFGWYMKLRRKKYRRGR